MSVDVLNVFNQTLAYTLPSQDKPGGDGITPYLSYGQEIEDSKNRTRVDFSDSESSIDLGTMTQSEDDLSTSDTQDSSKSLQHIKDFFENFLINLCMYRTEIVSEVLKRQREYLKPLMDEILREDELSLKLKPSETSKESQLLSPLVDSKSFATSPGSNNSIILSPLSVKSARRARNKAPLRQKKPNFPLNRTSGVSAHMDNSSFQGDFENTKVNHQSQNESFTNLLKRSTKKRKSSISYDHSALPKKGNKFFNMANSLCKLPVVPGKRSSITQLRANAGQRLKARAMDKKVKEVTQTAGRILLANSMAVDVNELEHLSPERKVSTSFGGEMRRKGTLFNGEDGESPKRQGKGRRITRIKRPTLPKPKVHTGNSPPLAWRAAKLNKSLSRHKSTAEEGSPTLLKEKSSQLLSVARGSGVELHKNKSWSASH